MALVSKDIIIILIGGIIAIFAAILSPYLLRFNISNITGMYIILVVLILVILVIIWAINKKTNEIKDELENQKLEQQKLNEKLKIYEQLIDMKAEIKELQNEVFYGKKK